MSFTIPQFITYLLALSGTIGLVWFLFEKAGDTLKPEVKQNISTWLLNLDPAGKVANWPEQFGQVFDRVFGEKHLSWRCFWRSSMATLLALSLVSLSFYSADLLMPEKWDLDKLLYFVISANLLADYFSLLESRLIIGFMGKRKGVFSNGLLIILDLLSTAAIYLAFGGVYGAVRFDCSYFEGILRLISKLSEPEFDLFAFFLSTFFTSVWVWLYFLSGMVVKATTRLTPALNFLKNTLDIENKPLRSMGIVAIGIVIVLFVVGVFA